MTTDRDRLRRLKALLDAPPEGAGAGEPAPAPHDAEEEERVVERGLAMVRAERARLQESLVPLGPGGTYRLQAEPPPQPTSPASPAPPPSMFRRWLSRPSTLRLSLAANAVTIALIIAGARGWNPFGRFTPVMSVMGSEVLVYDSKKTDEPFWRHEFRSPVEIAKIAPWDKGTTYVLVAEAEGSLRCFDIHRNVEVWENHVPREEVEAFFGAERVDPGSFRCATLDFVDLEGDGEPEVMASFAHRVYLPCAIHTLARDGTQLGTYLNWGLLCTSAVTDLDEDGRQELVAGGTDNAKELQAATLVVLDRDHLSGASVDQFIRPPGFQDGSRERLLIPQFPADLMKALNWDRIHAFKISPDRDPAGRPMLRVSVGTDEDHVMVLVNHELTPTGALATDAFTRKMGGWRDAGVITSDLAEPAVMDKWLGGYYLFEAGRQVHPPVVIRS